MVSSFLNSFKASRIAYQFHLHREKSVVGDVSTIVTLREDVVRVVDPVILNRQTEKRALVLLEPFSPHPDPDRRLDAPRVETCAPIPVNVFRCQAHKLPQHGPLPGPGPGLRKFFAGIVAGCRYVAAGNLKPPQ